MPNIIELEHNQNWQATAENKNQDRIAIVRAENGTYYLYGGMWIKTELVSSYVSSIEHSKGRPPLSTAEVMALLDSGELKIIKGKFPADKN